MTYDHWKTTEPDGGASPPPEDDGFTEAINTISAELDRLRASHDALLAAAKKVLDEEDEVVCEMRCFDEFRAAVFFAAEEAENEP